MASLVMDDFHFSPIGYVESCFKQKFAIPRQPGLAPHAKATIKLTENFTPETVDGLELSTHIWVQFVFHQTMEEGWSPRVRPPRLGGNRKMGVFATRSTHRPNPIGMSVVTLDGIDVGGNNVRLHVSGVDLLDGTPVLDIKPYLPYVDSVRTASNKLALMAPSLLVVKFTDKAMGQIESMQQGQDTDLLALISEILAQDPRPAYQKMDEKRTYGVTLLDFELKWRYFIHGEEASVEVLELIPHG
jgi:tRNA-Thr(GGU) m(6)t(6)A37 methyltransferase TsaA